MFYIYLDESENELTKIKNRITSFTWKKICLTCKMQSKEAKQNLFRLFSEDWENIFWNL